MGDKRPVNDVRLRERARECDIQDWGAIRDTF